MPQKLLTTKQASDYLASLGLPYTVSTLNTWRCRGEGPAFVKIRNNVRYEEAELQRFVKSGITVQTRDTVPVSTIR